MQTTARELLDNSPTVSVGMLTADLLHLGDELHALDEAGVKLVHVDVMDGVFCPPTTFGSPIVSALPDRFVKDVHLMVDEPLEKVGACVEAGAGILTFHVRVDPSPAPSASEPRGQGRHSRRGTQPRHAGRGRRAAAR